MSKEIKIIQEKDVIGRIYYAVYDNERNEIFATIYYDEDAEEYALYHSENWGDFHLSVLYQIIREMQFLTEKKNK